MSNNVIFIAKHNRYRLNIVYNNSHWIAYHICHDISHRYIGAGEGGGEGALTKYFLCVSIAVDMKFTMKIKFEFTLVSFLLLLLLFQTIKVIMIFSYVSDVGVGS